MKPYLLPIIGLAACLLLSACNVISENPLSSPDTAVVDQRLVGDWHGKKDDTSDTFRFSIKNDHWMHVEIIPDPVPGEKSRKGDKPESYDFFPTVIGKNTFLNAVLEEKDDKGGPTKAYVFIRYTISSDGALHMWQMSQDVAADAIRAGNLKGIVHQDKTTFMGQPSSDIDVTLQDKSAKLVKFIKGADLDVLFSQKMDVLYRVKTAGK